MKIYLIIKEIKGIFKPPKKKYYLGKLKYGTPYFYPINFSSSIIKIRKLETRSNEEYQEYIKKYPYLKSSDKSKFKNLPMVRRSKDWIIKTIFGYFWIEIGYPIKIYTNDLGWKDKWNNPRFEWTPAFSIFFFNWQFCIFWIAPDGNNDLYYEMILWYLKYNNKDIKKAKETWGWQNCETKESTWNNKYLI